MSTAKYRKKLRGQLNRQAKLIEHLLELGPGLRGTVSQVYTRCGKPNCWCVDSTEGHPHLRITWSQQGRMITRKIPPAELPKIRSLTENYRRFRSLRRSLTEGNIRIKQILDNYETAMNNEIRSGLSFLGLSSKNASPGANRRQKARKKDKGNIL